jgi:signal transduction histidine kinase
VHADEAVETNGPGIPAEHLPHVFRRFYRADKHCGRQAGGVDLGLSLVRAITEAHGGNPRITSQIGEGTIVTLTMSINGEHPA